MASISKLKKDIREAIRKNIESMVESHLECWKDRYYGKNIKQLTEDLCINHDPSLEIERLEEEIKRELSDIEQNEFIDYFNKKVIKAFKEGF